MTQAELTAIRDIFAGLPNRDDMAPSDLRAMYEQFAASLPQDMAIERTSVTLAGRPAEWSSPAGADPGRVLLYLHGGGYVIGSPATHRAITGGAARAISGRVLALDYRLAPEHAYPAALDDAVAAYRALLDQGIKPQNLAIGGDSAGGGLTLATLLKLRDQGVPLPAAAWCISPWADLEGLGVSMDAKASVDPIVKRDGLAGMAAAYLAGHNAKDPLVGPIYGDYKGLPPLLIQVGSAETLLDDAIRVAQRAGAADVEAQLEIWPDMIHVWHFFAPILSEGREAIAQAGAWLKAKMA